jgi:SAM-dependent MidA family methyltransferase
MARAGSCVSALLDEIRRIIALEGPIMVERYMALCLGHPRHGYYMTRDPLGVDGDFVTAPEISQMFGELIGLFIAQCWMDLGKPAATRLVEYGPGRGTLMLDALRAMAVVPGLHGAMRVEMIETSPVLADIQRRTLKAVNLPIHWRATLADVPDEDEPLIILGNEFLDALPIRQYIRQKGHWHERLVGLDGARLIFGLSPVPEPALRQAGPEGAVLEVCFPAHGFVADLAPRLRRAGGVALFLDYGHVRSGFGDTLQALRRHDFVDPLATPGDADLTAHVDFEALARSARGAGLVVHGPIGQGAFLQALGLEARADQLIQGAPTPQKADEVRMAERRLTEMTRTGMGSLFKAMAFTAPGQPVPPGGW